MVIVKLEISNVFGSLWARLVLDVLSNKDSRDYTCDIEVDEDFETTVHELRTYFGFVKFTRTCETILHFYSYDGATNYVKCTPGGLLTVFPLVTLHLWVRIFKKFRPWSPCIRWWCQHNNTDFQNIESDLRIEVSIQIRPKSRFQSG